ncbi:MATE family efflux transporter [Oenococcus kitaharae]|uniref:MATE family efflux transporter n=1 Tax=Oenococcus TaxID=46254 RepID=UPI0021E7BA2E|nr:MATE family efflux transporter [Oenococcus kitaharae]MCV3296992.1 MATE family efflux transporter [Oenococcus kitaharae]
MHSLTEGKPLKLIIFFTIPLLLGNLFQQLYTLTDTVIVGRTLGVNALAAVSLATTLNWLLVGFAQGFTAGTAIITAKRFGAGDLRGVRQSMVTTIFCTAALTAIMTFIAVVFNKEILQLMQTPQAVMEQANIFLTILLGFMFTTMSYNLAANAMRAVGNSRAPLIFLIVAVFFNIVLELLFIVVFSWGVSGAAFATVIAQFISGAISFVYIYRVLPVLQVHRHDWHTSWLDIKEHLHSGLPMAFQNSIIAIGAVILQTALNTLGTDSVASSGAASRIDQLATLPMMSVGITMATFTAQNLGAKKYSRILEGVKQALFVSGSWAVLMSILEINFGHYLIQFILGSGSQQNNVLALSRTYFLVNGGPYILLATLFLIRYTLQGLGNASVPTVAGIFELSMRAFAGLVLVGLFGYTGAVLGSPLAWAGSLLALTPAWFSARRKLTKLKDGQEVDIHLEGR